MITIYKIENINREKTGENIKEDFILSELRGLSTDEKPTEIKGNGIENGSSFIEIDTGKIYLYDRDNEQWKEI